MMKNVTAYKANSEGTERLFGFYTDALIEAIEEHPSLPPAATIWRRWGFSKTDHFGKSPLFEGADGARVLYVQQQERVLPGTVIRRALLDKVLEIQERDDRKLNRKEIAQLKDDVIAELLPKAFIKQSGYHVLIYKGWLLIDSGSAKICEEIVGFLRAAFEEIALLSLRPMRGKDVESWLKGMAIDAGTDTGNFHALDSMVLKSKSLGTVRFKDAELDSDEVTEALQSDRDVTELALAWRKDADASGDDMHFTLTNKLIIKRIKFADILLKQAHDEGDENGTVGYFDANIAITAPLLVGLIEGIEAEVYVPEEKPVLTGAEDL